MTDTRFESARGEVFVPSVWRPFYEQTSIPAAVRAGDTLRVTGHTGDNADGVYSEDVEDQIRTTFSNVAMTLAAAGAGWSDVVEIHSYHVGLPEQARAVLGVAAEFLDAPYPAWTAVGVTELFSPKALIEIRCLAVLADH
jgi:enamine deaminase RidA (YjgF/YER057c/UK114 family)